MSEEGRFLITLLSVLLAVLLILSAAGCGAEENEMGESLISDFCGGAVTVYNVPNTNEPEVAWDEFDAFVVKPDKECGVLPTLYCVYVVGEWHGGGTSCTPIDQ